MYKFAIIVFLFQCHLVFSQNVGINEDGSLPDSSAILDLKSTSKGFLLPRMTNTQRNAISDPEPGLMIFSLTDSCIHFFNGRNWKPTCGKLIGSESGDPGKDCQHILNEGASVGDGIYWIDPDSTGAEPPFQCYCDMTTDGGGWTKLESITHPSYFSTGDWQSKNPTNPLDNWYSILGKRARFVNGSGCYTFRLVVGNSGNWLSPPAHKTVWIQCHDPFTSSTNGSDYTFISGDQSSTCGGFNGLHSKFQGYSYASDPDLNDNNSCWYMQIVPHTSYSNNGYSEGYGGPGNFHIWQSLWVR